MTGPATAMAPSPIPPWPGRMIDLGTGEQVWLLRAPRPGDPPDPTDPPAPGGESGLYGEGADGGIETTLLLHGMSGAATNWTDLMRELAPDFDCVAVDLPGSGFSPPPRRASGYSVRALAGTVIALIEALGRESGGPAPVHLVGNSMGGAIAVRVAASRPDLVRTLTLISPALPDRRVHRSTIHFPVISLPFAGEWLVRGYVRRFRVEDRVAGALAACLFDPGSVPPERFAQEVEELRRRDGLSYDAASLVRTARTLTAETLTPRRLSLWRAAELVSAPALVLFGSHDRLVSPQLAAPAARAFRDARVLVLPRTGHIAQMECPALVAAHFREMVEGYRVRGRAGECRTP